MKKAIGIDLGTTNSVMAFKTTSVKIIRNKQDEELTPSCVSFRDGNYIVGKYAVMDAERDKVNTVKSIKRLMGGAIKEKTVKEMIESKYYDYEITSLSDGTEDSVAVVLGNNQFTPEQISAKIIKKLKEDAEEYFKDEVTHAVITVPAYFTEKQKNATIRAAEIAGLKVQKLLAEPTAAAIAYGVDELSKDDEITIMVYDFGGGTFDLSILNITNGQFIEVGTSGNRWLGGDDIDRAIMEYLLRKISDKYKIKNIDESIIKLPKKRRWAFEEKLKNECEKAKIRLSGVNSVSIYIDNLQEDEYGDIITIDLLLTRIELEDIVRSFVSKTIEIIKKLFAETNYDITMIDYLLLVGGSSCIPLVKEMLGKEFGVQKIKLAAKPMLTVAEGAAILAHRLCDDYEQTMPNQNSVTEVAYSAKHNYYLQIAASNAEEDSSTVFDLIIEKQSPLPVEISKIYKTSTKYQKIVLVNIFAEVENNKKELQTKGFVTINENLDTGSELIFDIKFNLNELFEINVRSRNGNKKNSIYLARGIEDQKALEFMSNSLSKVMRDIYQVKQKEFFFDAAETEIKRINTLNPMYTDVQFWKETGTRLFTAFEHMESINEDNGKDINLYWAKKYVVSYADILPTEIIYELKRLIDILENNSYFTSNGDELEKLIALVDQYIFIIGLERVKLAIGQAENINPSDANQLQTYYDKIFDYFRDDNYDEAIKLIDEARILAKKYLANYGTGTGSIYVKK